MSLALYRKYRPSDFDEVVGQEHVVRTLKNAVKNGRLSHAYLFSGPRGTGKTSIARILAKAVNCENPKDGEPCNECPACKDIASGRFLDLVEIDAATHTQVDKMRDIIERINLSPSCGKKKVYIIDEVHMLSKGAFNALLKTLEEPPAYVLFILATTEIHKIPATIISRCQRFDFRHLRVEEIKERLAEIAKTEKVEVEDGVLEFVAITSGGGMRDSESLFGQIIALQDDKKITLKEVQEILSLPDISLSVDIVKLVRDGKYGDAIAYINRIAEDGCDLSQLNKSLIEYLRKLLLIKLSPGMREHFSSSMTAEQINELEEIAKSIHVSRIFRIISAFVKSQPAIKGAIVPQLPLELAIAEIKIADDGGLTEESNGDYNNKAGMKPQMYETAQKKPQEPEEKKTIKKNVAEKIEAVIEGVSPEQQEVSQEQQETVQEEAPAEAANETSSGNFATFEQVKDEWPEIVQDMRKYNNSLTACLKTCQPVIADGNQIVIACQYSFHTAKLQKIENRTIAEHVASEAVQAEVRFRFIDKEEAQNLGFEIKEIEIEEKQSEDLVNSALDMFGGELVA